eukprot:TRINITY_DN1075_c0_g2_i1.p1 TRINITY_DN1075_c0_g2~~TRINITY_DN1075_c0_g2_i1.p1  ORF type:complete len:529 (+),score=111.09 TRINITY_DN1075_c0_g2_i1:86-1672(+)
MAAPPPGYWPPPPHLAPHAPPPHLYPPSRPPPYHPHHAPRPGVAPFGPPPGFPPYQGYPPPHRGSYGPPPEATAPQPQPHPHYRERSPPRQAAPPPAARPGGNFAEEKPAAYQAFKERAVRIGQSGAEVALSGGMCEDRHVNDFLLCLQCWLWRTFGDPRSSGQPWRLKRLDLSKNSLSDESLCAVIESMKRLDLRVERVFLSGNRLRDAGIAAMTEYLWNCQDALWELDLSDNEAQDDEKVSALLRCLYNHRSYPVMLEHRKVLPFLLRLGGNSIRGPDRLLHDIRTKAVKDGREMIRICDSPDSYIQPHEEFLSVYMPDFLRQKSADGQLALPVSSGQGDPSSGVRLRSRSRRRRRRKEADATAASAPAPAPVPVASAPPVPAPVQAPSVPEPAEREGNRQRQRRKKEKVLAAEQPATDVLAEKTATTQDVNADKTPLLTEEEQQRLQSELGKKLSKIAGLPSDQGTCSMLAEFTVCMLVAKKTREQVQSELAAFLGEEHAGPLASWFAKHVRHHYKNAAKMAGWK